MIGSFDGVYTVLQIDNPQTTKLFNGKNEWSIEK